MRKRPAMEPWVWVLAFVLLVFAGVVGVYAQWNDIEEHFQ